MRNNPCVYQQDWAKSNCTSMRQNTMQLLKIMRETLGPETETVLDEGLYEKSRHRRECAE